MIANLPMGGNKITGMADPTLATDGTTKNYVDNAVGSFFSTGDIKASLKTAADSGWLLLNDTTFGSLTSGAATQNNATQALFTLLFNVTADADVPLFTSSGVSTTRGAQGSASAAWAANCRMSLPKALGRVFASAGAGAGLTSRALGSAAGLETATLATTNLPAYTPAGTIGTVTVNSTVGFAQFAGTVGVPGGTNQIPIVNATNAIVPSTGSGPTFTGSAQGGASTPFSILQPSLFVNWMIKL